MEMMKLFAYCGVFARETDSSRMSYFPHSVRLYLKQNLRMRAQMYCDGIFKELGYSVLDSTPKHHAILVYRDN